MLSVIFFKLEIGKKVEAVYLLILIPLLIQSTISIFNERMKLIPEENNIVLLVSSKGYGND